MPRFLQSMVVDARCKVCCIICKSPRYSIGGEMCGLLNCVSSAIQHDFLVQL